MKIWIVLSILISSLVGCSQTVSDQRLVVPATISGLSLITHFIGDDAVDLLDGVTVNHNYYELSILDITMESSNIIWDKEGVYVIFYRVETPFGVVTRESRIVTILSSNQVDAAAFPLILNATDLSYIIGDQMPDYNEGVTAFDIKDGYLNVIIDDSLVNYDEPGVYTVTYSVTNRKGLETTKTIEMTVIKREVPLSLIYLNDFHGAILKTQTQIGLSGIASYIESLEAENTLFISGGDMLQGSMLSNYFYGAPIIEALNALHHASFTIGNHEFDWGIEALLKYKDSNEDVVADFNFLGTNIRYTSNSLRPEHIKAYDIVIRDGKKIGIIGAMGFGLESSIATSKIRGYMFTDPVQSISEDAHTLRSMYDVDVVIAVIHGSHQPTNQRLADLTGTSRVDAIFNGHTHQTYINETNQRNNIPIPIIQAGAYGMNVAHVDFYFQSNTLVNVESRMLNKSSSQAFLMSSAAIDSIIEPYFLEIQPLLETNILSSGQAYSRADLTQFMARIMADEVDASVGIHNYGGTRVALGYLEAITVGKVYEIFPFDNTIKTVYLKGSEINNLISNFQSSEVYVKPGTLLLEDTYYKVATNDYLFDKENYPFLNGNDIVHTGIIIRDVFISSVEIQSQTYDYFYISQYTDVNYTATAYTKRRTYGTFI